MCNLCKMKKRTKKYKNAGVGKIKTQDLILQAAGVGGSAVASAADAIFQRIPFLADNADKVGLAKGAAGWFLANNPFDVEQLDNEYLKNFGFGMMYYGWGQWTAEKLNLRTYIDKAANGSLTPEQSMIIDPIVAGDSYYDDMDDYIDEGVETQSEELVV